MLKTLVVCAAIGVSVFSVTATAWENPAIPSLKQQYEDAKISEVVQIFENDPYFAGKTVNIEMFGKKIAVDRTREPNTTPNGTPPPSPAGGLSTLTDILDGLNAEAKGQVQINVERKFSEGGVLLYEKWGIVVGGQYAVKKEALTPPKEEKGTGEAQ